MYKVTVTVMAVATAGDHRRWGGRRLGVGHSRWGNRPDSESTTDSVPVQQRLECQLLGRGRAGNEGGPWECACADCCRLGNLKQSHAAWRRAWCCSLSEQRAAAGGAAASRRPTRDSRLRHHARSALQGASAAATAGPRGVLRQGEQAGAAARAGARERNEQCRVPRGARGAAAAGGRRWGGR